uniref:C2H2-type domain-containing protein n=1 Tax=Ascaris lumbricoides TaxID=6252 RepID=A0A9J2PR87_ASCLU
MNTHGDHQCTMCDYTSRTEGRLKKHMRDSHTVEEQMAAGLDMEPSCCSSATATPITSSMLSAPSGINLTTTVASVFEAANLAAAAQAAQAAALSADNDNPTSIAPSSKSDNNEQPSSTTVTSTSIPTSLCTNSFLPSALDQIRAFTEDPSILPDLSSANLATALMSHGLLNNAPSLSEPSTSSLPTEEPSSSSLSTERRSSGGKPKTYKCKQCNHVSISKEEQWAHARTHIPIEKQLGCTRCGFVTEYKHHLEYHLRNHMGSKPFHCKKCAYSCVNKSMLNSHMKSHTNIYQFRCRDCTYATKYCHSLKLHLKKYNHNRAGDANETIAINANNVSPFESINENDTLRHLSDSYSMNGVDGDSPSPQSSIPQSLANAITLNPIVTSSSLNLASQLLLRQHQLEQMDAVMRINTLSGMGAGSMLTSRCALCNYQSLNQEDNIRHQVNHLIAPQSDNPLASLCNSIGLPTSLRPSSTTANEEDEENTTLKADEKQSGNEEEQDVTIENMEQEEHRLCNISGESHTSPPGSAKSSGDEGSLTTDETGDKGARKRKAGLKLNQIAARLHEKNSPGVDDVVDTNEEVKREKMDDDEKESVVESPIATCLPIPAPIVSRPTPSRLLPHLLLPEDTGHLNIFQQACIAHMHSMEQKFRSAFDMWRFSCPHCKMAFQDEPLFHIHMGYHGYDNPFKCNRCGQSCNDGLTFNLHLLQAKH